MSARSFVLVGALSVGLACAQNNTAKPSCEEACRVANMSNNDLQTKFGAQKVPKRYAFATPYVEGVSYEEFKRCLDEAVQQKTTTKALGCSERAHHVCVDVCKGTTTNETAAVAKEPTPPPPPNRSVNAQRRNGASTTMSW